MPMSKSRGVRCPAWRNKPIEPAIPTTIAIHAVTRSRLRNESDAIVQPSLFVNRLELLLDHLAGEPIDRDVEPISFFAFNDELSESGSTWRITARLCDHVDHKVPDTRLAHL